MPPKKMEPSKDKDKDGDGGKQGNGRRSSSGKSSEDGKSSPGPGQSTSKKGDRNQKKGEPKPQGEVMLKTLTMLRSTNWDVLISHEKASAKRISQLEKKGKEDQAQVKDLQEENGKLKKDLEMATTRAEQRDKDAKGKASELGEVRERERKLNEALTQALGDKLEALQAAAQLKEDLAQAKKKEEKATQADAKMKEELAQLKKQLEEKEEELLASGARENLLQESVANMRRQIKLDKDYEVMAGQRRSLKEGEGGDGTPAKKAKEDTAGEGQAK